MKLSSFFFVSHASAAQQQKKTQGKSCNGISRATPSDKMIGATIEEDSMSFGVQIYTIRSLHQLIKHEKDVGNQAY